MGPCVHHCCQVPTGATPCWRLPVSGTMCASLLSGANRRHTVLAVTCQWDRVCITAVRCQQAPHRVGGYLSVGPCVHHCCQVPTGATPCWRLPVSGTVCASLLSGANRRQPCWRLPVSGTMCASLLSGANRRHTVLAVTCQWDHVCITAVRCQQTPHSVGGGGGWGEVGTWDYVCITAVRCQQTPHSVG